MNANVDYIIKTAIGEFNYLDYKGQHITATNSIEGHARSAILKGNTLVNISSLNGEITLAPASVQYIDSPFIKNDTTFTISFNCSSVPTTGFIEFRQVFENTALKMENKPVVQGYNRFKVITGSSEINRFRFKNDSTSETDFIFNNLMILEGDYTNVDVPYFTGMQSVKMPVLTTTGKNLIQQMTFKKSGDRNISNETIKVTKGVTYTLSFSSGIINTALSLTRNNTSVPPIPTENESVVQNLIGFSNYSSVTFTAVETGEFYLHFRGNVTETSESLSNSNIQLEEGSVATSYEPFKSNILTVNEEVELRGIGDVQDTLNCLTGEVTERIGEYQITGEENWDFLPSVRRLQIQNPKFIPNIKCGAFACDKLQAKQMNDGSLHGTVGTYYIGYTSDNWLRIILGEDLTSLEQGKEWLKANKPTIQYQLKTESIKTVDLSDNHVYSYKGTTHYDCSSAEGSLVPTLSVKVPTDTQLTIQEQKATTQTLLIKNMDLQQSIKEVQAMNLAFNTALYNSFNSIREEVEDIKKHVSTNENLEGSF